MRQIQKQITFLNKRPIRLCRIHQNTKIWARNKDPLKILNICNQTPEHMRVLERYVSFRVAASEPGKTSLLECERATHLASTLIVQNPNLNSIHTLLLNLTPNPKMVFVFRPVSGPQKDHWSNDLSESIFKLLRCLRCCFEAQSSWLESWEFISSQHPGPVSP